MHIKEFVKQLEEIMSAVSFAEAGERDTAITILHGRKKVLLVLKGEETDMKAAKYALNLCSRIKVGMEILYITEENAEKANLHEYLKELQAKGIEYQVTECKESLRKAIMQFIQRKKGIQFVVIDSHDLGIESEREAKKPLEKWEKMECPLVLVSGLSEG
jgi:HSP90 family molecular chaperone